MHSVMQSLIYCMRERYKNRMNICKYHLLPLHLSFSPSSLLPRNLNLLSFALFFSWLVHNTGIRVSILHCELLTQTSGDDPKYKTEPNPSTGETKAISMEDGFAGVCRTRSGQVAPKMWQVFWDLWSTYWLKGGFGKLVLDWISKLLVYRVEES